VLNTKPRYALDFFAGSGLAAEGLSPYFKVIWANDISKKKAATYIANHPRKTFHLQDITEITGDQLPKAELSWASFPCQDLSLAGNLMGINNSRSGLVWQWIRVMDEMATRPPVLVAENVVGFLSAAKGAHYLAVHQALFERGYHLGAVVLDASCWVPQSRPRVFLIGVSAKLEGSLKFAGDGPNWCHDRAIQRVARLVDEFIWWKVPKPICNSKSLEDLIDFKNGLLSVERSQKNIDLIPSQHLKKLFSLKGEDIRVFPGYKRTRNGRQVLELRFDGKAGCLRTPGGGSSRQFLVFFENGVLKTRLLSVRETARLMGARESYKIAGSYNDGYRAMGDAVVVPVVRYLAKNLLAPLADEVRNERSKKIARKIR
jgi:DNA (cytosine-5)-methyltransferase 1